ncbi:2611_t:CDS:2 [Paraglomus occultum]|uniref:GTP cyclohydrolase II n=1 Tax=Paraglomus occultum TaxID=144539 RepID=A0A9N8Z1D5_9GLOM|nr:2611_t:CDS:2 [Paraglomus occultum]
MGYQSVEESLFAQSLDVSPINGQISVTAHQAPPLNTLIHSPHPSQLLSSSHLQPRKCTPAKKPYSTQNRTPLRTLETLTPPATPTRNTSLTVECQVRARLPTSTGELFLHLYKNNRDSKEHLAIVFGDDIRSKSLDAPRPRESEMDRIVRGAYVGRLRPGQKRSNEYSGSNNIEKGNVNNVLNGNALNTTNDTNTETVLNTSTLNTANKITTPITNTSSLQLCSPPLVRIHSECFTGETVNSARCDCGEQLQEAMRLIQQEGRGVIVYLRQEGRGIGLAEKLRAYNLQDLGHDTVTANILLHHPPDLRNYDIATQILSDLGVTTIRLLTNNPDKIEQIEADEIKVIQRIPMVPKAWREGKVDQEKQGSELDNYLRVKVERMRHLLDIPGNLLTQESVSSTFWRN